MLARMHAEVAAVIKANLGDHMAYIIFETVKDLLSESNRPTGGLDRIVRARWRV